MKFTVTCIMLTLGVCAVGCKKTMQFFSKRLIVFLLLLVLLSLAAHVLADIQHADQSFQAKWDMCLLHAGILLLVVALTGVSPAISEILHRIANSHPVPSPLPFRPPIF